MDVFTPEFIEKYQKIYESEPQSKVFAPLAEAYRKTGDLKSAFDICKKGCIQHPLFASGHVCMGRIFKDMKQFDKALLHLRKASQLAPENIQAHMLMAEIYIESRKPKEALQAFKQVLFLNPKDIKAQKSVKKLESLTADEFDSDTFQLGNLFEVETSPLTMAEKEKASERITTLVDAYLVRNEFEKAQSILNEAIQKFGNQKDLVSRRELIENQKKSNQDNDDAIEAEELYKNRASQSGTSSSSATFHPQSFDDLKNLKRQKQIRKKIQYLESLIQKIQDTKGTSFTF